MATKTTRLKLNVPEGSDNVLLSTFWVDNYAILDNCTQYNKEELVERTWTFPAIKLRSYSDYSLQLQYDGILTADRVLALNVEDGHKTLKIQGSAVLDNWFDQSVKSDAIPTFRGIRLSECVDGVLVTNSVGEVVAKRISILENTDLSPVEPLVLESSQLKLNYDFTDFEIVSTQFRIRDSGIDHTQISGLEYDSHTQYLLANGSRQLSSDWYVGDKNIITDGDILFSQFARHATALLPNKTIYVSPSGDDNLGEGSVDKPFKSIKRALDALPDVIQDNVIVAVSPGEYLNEEIDLSRKIVNGSIVVRCQTLDNYLCCSEIPILATTYSTTSIGSSALNLSPNSLEYGYVWIVAGTGQGQIRSISSNTSTVINVNPAWDVVPDGTSYFCFCGARVTGLFKISDAIFTGFRLNGQKLNLNGGVINCSYIVCSDGLMIRGLSEVNGCAVIVPQNANEWNCVSLVNSIVKLNGSLIVGLDRGIGIYCFDSILWLPSTITQLQDFISNFDTAIKLDGLSRVVNQDINVVFDNVSRKYEFSSARYRQVSISAYELSPLLELCNLSSNPTADPLISFCVSEANTKKFVIGLDVTDNSFSIAKTVLGYDDVFRIKENGNVLVFNKFGIGTDPQSEFHIKFGQKELNFSSVGLGDGVNMFTNSELFIGTLSTTGIHLLTDSSERIIITKEGNVGIACIPNFRLDVSGILRSSKFLICDQFDDIQNVDFGIKKLYSVSGQGYEYYAMASFNQVTEVNVSGEYWFECFRAKSYPIVRTGKSNSRNVFGGYIIVGRNSVSGEDDGGSLNNMFGLEVEVGHDNVTNSSPSTANVYGIYIHGYRNSGTISNYYGAYFENPSGVTNNFGIYQATVSARNYFGGRVGIGTVSPSAALHVVASTGYNQLRLQTSYTPSGSGDTNGNVGDIAWDNNYVYVKTSVGWKRAQLSSF